MLRSFVRIIYSLIPNLLKISCFLILRKMFTLNHNLYQHLHFKGFFKQKFKDNFFYIYSLPTQIENSIFWEGVNKAYEPLTLDCWYFICKKSNEVFDIGSNTGIFILISNISNKKANIHSFDPSKEFIIAQKKIKEKNKLDNLRINNFALGNFDGEINYDGYQVHLEDDELFEKVKVHTLSNYLKKNNIKLNNFDSIKIDAEHFEYFILKDIYEIIKNKIPNIILEIRLDEEGEQIDNLLKEIDYSIYSIDDKTFKIKKLFKIEKSLYRNILLLNKKYQNEFEKEYNHLII